MFKMDVNGAPKTGVLKNGLKTPDSVINFSYLSKIQNIKNIFQIVIFLKKKNLGKLGQIFE